MKSLDNHTTNINENSQEKLSSKQRNEASQESSDFAYDRIMTLQGTMGNKAVGQLFSSRELQAKLTVGSPGDKYEVEADATADKVMSMSHSQVQRQSDEEEVHTASMNEEEVQSFPGKEEVQMSPEDDELHSQSMEEETVQGKGTVQREGLSDSLSSQIQGIKSGGQPMPKASRDFFEPRFGADFSNVKIHNDSTAHETSAAINAKAYTLGNHVAFGKGQYNPESSEGKHLMAHELTHVVQQGGSRINKKVKNRLSARTVQRDLRSDTRRNTIEIEIGKYFDNLKAKLNEFETSLTSSDSSSTSTIIIDSVVSLFSLVPVVGAPVATIYQALANSFRALESSATRVNLATFINRARRNLTNLKTNHSTRYAQNVINLILRGSIPSINAIMYRSGGTAFSLAIRNYLGTVLPNPTAFHQRLVNDWVNSATDGYDNGDWGGVDAGYIYVGLGYRYHLTGWGNQNSMYRTRAPFIDDIDRPDGTIQVMKDAYGENKPLDAISGIRMNMNVYVRGISSQNRSIALGTVRLIKPKGSTNIQTLSMNTIDGTESQLRMASIFLRQGFVRSPGRPLVKHLVAD